MKENNLKDWMAKPYSNGLHVAELAVGTLISIVPAIAGLVWYGRQMSKLRKDILDEYKTEEDSEDKED